MKSPMDSADWEVLQTNLRALREAAGPGALGAHAQLLAALDASATPHGLGSARIEPRHRRPVEKGWRFSRARARAVHGKTG